MSVYFAFVTGNHSYSLVIWSSIDGLILFSPVLIMRSKRWIIVSIYWIVAIYLAVNCMYAQFFSNVIRIRNYWLASTVDSLVMKSVLSNLKLSDIIFLICPIIVTIVAARPSIRQSPAPLPGRWLKWFFAGLIILIGIRQIPYMIRSCRSDKNLAIGMYNLQFNESLSNCQWMGIAFYIPWSIITTIINGNGTIELTQAQIQEIDNYFNKNSTINAAIAENRGKNLIFIVVESLNSWQVNYERDGFELMPNLRHLLQEDGVVSNLNVFSQVGPGGSSDGQFIYNTGLLPLRDDIVATSFGHLSYPSLARSLKGYRSVEVICEKPGVWNHSETTIAYGYDRLYSKLDIEEAGFDMDKIGYDEALLRFSANLSAQLPQPFFMFVTTLSMHIPYDLINCEIPAAVNSDKSLNDDDKKFAANTHYFDRCLGMFIENLKRNGIYDKSVIVLAADHSYDTRQKFRVEEASEIAFAALNTGITRCLTDTVGQIDVFPTVLDLMGLEPPYRGLGTSMLAPGEKGVVGFSNENKGNVSDSALTRMNNAWNISRLIIRGDYFGNRKQAYK